MTAKIFFDGGCKPNPGIMEVCVVLDLGEGEPLVFVERDLGEGTNNVAEWTALCWAVTLAADHGLQRPTVFGDSMLVIRQALGEWSIKQRQFLGFQEEFNRVNRTVNARLNHVPRDANWAGNWLELGRFTR